MKYKLIPQSEAQKFFIAFSKLSPRERKALTKAGSRSISGTTFSEPDDLLHEALVRILEGRRNRPQNVSLGIFLNMAMSSVADANRQSHGNRRPLKREDEDIPDDGDCEESLGGEFGNHAPSLEEQLIVKEELEDAIHEVSKIRDSMSSDAAAITVLDGILREMTPQEIREAHGLSASQFDAARHRVRRRLLPLRDSMRSARSGSETLCREPASCGSSSASGYASTSRVSTPDEPKARSKKHRG
jgi:DNA-directed RNA polymerase specialized sigma24 family protein